MRLLRLTALLVLTAVLASGATAGAAALITGRQVKDGSLTGKDIRNGSITRSDLSASARAHRGATGARGLQGVKGDTGTAGLPTRSATATGTSVIPAGQTFAAEAQCPSQAPYAVGGGSSIETVSGGDPGSLHPVVLMSESVTSPADGLHHAWRVIVRNDGTQSLVARADTVCMDTPAF